MGEGVEKCSKLRDVINGRPLKRAFPVSFFPDLDSIKAYIDSFRYGCPPHAGGGIGLVRTQFE
jgi:hypothetical protein